MTQITIIVQCPECFENPIIDPDKPCPVCRGEPIHICARPYHDGHAIAAYRAGVQDGQAVASPLYTSNATMQP